MFFHSFSDIKLEKKNRNAIFSSSFVENIRLPPLTCLTRQREKQKPSRERKRDETSSSQTQTLQTPRLLHLEHAQMPERKETLRRRTSGEKRKEEKTFHVRRHDAGKAETQSSLRFD